MSFSKKTAETAVAHLRRSDPVLNDLIRQVGPFTLRLERDRFGMLVRSILSQQISTRAAQAVRRRLDELIAPQRITPETLVGLSPSQLRSAGLSGQKARYLHDLSKRVLDGRLRLRTIGRLSDERVIEELTQVQGIGRWTAQMFLMFSLGRLDVFPHNDLGIRAALRDLYGLDELPDKRTGEEIVRPWRPYATVGCWYCWRLGDLRRKQENFAGGYPV